MNIEDDEEYRVKVRRCPETGNALEENWYHLNGDRGRNGAPARLVWDPHTFNLVTEEYWSMDSLQSPLSGKLPALTQFDPVSGDPVCRVWMRYHRKHRTGDLPAVEFLRDGKPLRHEYWVDGQLFRNSGPPIVNFDPETGEIVSTADTLEKKLQNIPRGYFPGPGP